MAQRKKRRAPAAPELASNEKLVAAGGEDYILVDDRACRRRLKRRPSPADLLPEPLPPRGGKRPRSIRKKVGLPPRISMRERDRERVHYITDPRVSLVDVADRLGCSWMLVRNWAQEEDWTRLRNEAQAEIARQGAQVAIAAVAGRFGDDVLSTIMTLERVTTSLADEFDRVREDDGLFDAKSVEETESVVPAGGGDVDSAPMRKKTVRERRHSLEIARELTALMKLRIEIQTRLMDLARAGGYQLGAAGVPRDRDDQQEVVIRIE